MLQKNKLFFLEDERIPLSQQKLDFDPAVIEGIVCNFFFLHNSVEALPNLRFVQVTSAGLDRIPVKELAARRTKVFNAGATYAIPMAEWVVCKILELYKSSRFFHQNQVEHRWEKNRGILELSGSTAAIIGFGNVGRNIAQRLRAFDVNICAVDVVEDSSGLCDEWYHISNMTDAIRRADVVVLTLPLLESTYHIMDETALSAMKQTAILVNVARGKLVDEKALEAHLENGKFMGVALDVFEEEPLSQTSPLWDIDRVIITPHNSFVGNGNQERLFNLLVSNIECTFA